MGDMPTGRRGLLHEEQGAKPAPCRAHPPGYLHDGRSEAMRQRLLERRVQQIVNDFSPTQAELVKVVKSVVG